MKKNIALSIPNLKGNELKYVSNAIKDEWVSTGGSYITEFENNIKEYVHANGAVACQNGTSGIHLSLVLNGVKQGDGVIAPTLTFIAAVNPIKYCGAEPFFMDCDDSLCMDMNKVKKFCEEECVYTGNTLVHNSTGIKITALIFVHVFGNIGDIEAALYLCKKYNLKLIEDATEALGSYINHGKLSGRFAGTIGDTGVFSFNGNKIITTGGGGMIVSNNDELLSHARYLSTQAKDDALLYIHNEIGYNYRMTNLQAAVGLAQLEQLDDFIKIKHRNYSRYIENGIQLLPFSENAYTNKWFYSYVTDRRDELIEYMKDNGIQARPIWSLNHLQKPYKDSFSYMIEKASFYLEHIVNIPCSTNLTLDDVDYVSQILKNFDKE